MEGLVFWWLGQQVGTGGGRGGAGEGKEEGREGQGNTGEEWGKWLGYLCRLGPGRIRGTCGRTRRLSGPTHFGPKSKTEMGTRGYIRTTLSVWIIPLD
jgi:hypothetical protein